MLKKVNVSMYKILFNIIENFTSKELIIKIIKEQSWLLQRSVDGSL